MTTLLFIIIQIWIIVLGYFLAKHDAQSYLLKDNNSNTSTLEIIKRWHESGVVLGVLVNIPLLYDFWCIWWQLAIVNVLLRLAEFDLVFNKYAKLSPYFLGSTATLDKFFSKIFGKNGAVTKSVTFFIILIIFNLAKIKFKF